MTLAKTFQIFLDRYQYATHESLSGHSIAKLVRNKLPKEIAEIIGDENRYHIQGSAGQGNWAKCPWIAIFDSLITNSAQKGYYVVYLVRQDFSGIYISLNQGVTSVREQYKSRAKAALKTRAANYRSKLGSSRNNLLKGPIDLRCESNDIASYYEKGAILSKLYYKHDFPDNRQLENDLKYFIDTYATLTTLDSELYERAHLEDDEYKLDIQNLRKIRAHKRIERNKKLSKAAKLIHGYRCKSCGLDFEEHYGSIGKNFIEAHHLNPLSSIEGHSVSLDPRRDFTVLCSNCHSMIHRSEFVDKVEEFRVKYLGKS